MKLEHLYRGLQVLRGVGERGEISVHDGFIWGGTSGLDLLPEDIFVLETTGWIWDGDHECWKLHV